MTVRKGADALMLAVVENGPKQPAMQFEAAIVASVLVVDPDRNMEAAAEVVDAITVAAGGSG